MSDVETGTAVAVITGPEDIRFGDAWIARRDETVAAALGIVSVSSDAELEAAGKVQTTLTRLVKELEAERMNMTRPLDALKKLVMDKAAEMYAPIHNQLERIRKLNVAYATEKARLAKEETERIAKLERERIERETAERVERERLAAAEAAAVFGESAVVDAGAGQAQGQPVVPQVVPRHAPPRTSVNSFVEVWKFDIVDSEKVPRELCSVDEQKIRAFLNYKKSLKLKPDEIVIAGVRVYSEMSVRAR